jgi:uncharacterized phage protein gp47/JayE
MNYVADDAAAISARVKELADERAAVPTWETATGEALDRIAAENGLERHAQSDWALRDQIRVLLVNRGCY